MGSFRLSRSSPAAQSDRDPACVDHDALDIPQKEIAIADLFNGAQHILDALPRRASIAGVDTGAL